MNNLRLLNLLARLLIVAIFLINGFGVVDQSVAVHEMIARGVPAVLAPLFGLAGQGIQILAGVGLALGRYPRLCSLALVAFLIPATLIAHAFWAAPQQLFVVQLINFLKNLSMIGGLLYIASAQPQSVSLKTA